MMKKLLLLLILIPALAYGWMPVVQLGGGVAGDAEPGEGTTIDDDFSTDISSGWTQEIGTWVYDGTGDDVDTPDGATGVLSNNTELDTINQYISVQFKDDDEGSSSYAGVYFRFDGNTSNRAYAIRYEKNSTQVVWRDCAGASCSTNGTAYSVTISDGDYIGAEVEGTGSSTIVRFWYFGSTLPARGSWGAADKTWTDTPGTAADSGKYVGLYDGGTSVVVTFDNFAAGTFTP